MLGYQRQRYWIIWLFFLLAFILQIIPWPHALMILRPNWLALFLIYWVIEYPQYVNIGTGFMVGLIWDLILGSILGIHALAFSLLAYLVAFKFQIFRNIPLWQHSLLVVFLTAAVDVIIFWGEFSILHVSFHPELFLNSIVNGVLWPWLSWLMRKLDYSFKL
ncbi:rod shape-determining protein MreD [Candidatus Profftia sp. (ex Adelges kitamiensis)]|uniref:rod shape-determining protein MreD n=1 Tax=Candidatus Profftia sp. (ex Adelges kitamiensis) TaxID=2864218 RepID=UPI001CE3AA20|nr:rod shape-determining protein MreD [Candidatus Profftia sp. (ex Adelges kitamiensis)]